MNETNLHKYKQFKAIRSCHLAQKLFHHFDHGSTLQAEAVAIGFYICSIISSNFFLPSPHPPIHLHHGEPNQWEHLDNE